MEKIKFQEAITNAEIKAKDFEYLLSELEYKVNVDKASTVEDDLRQEIKRLNKEIEQMGSHHDMIKSETSDLASELKALKLQLDEAQSKIVTQEFLLKQTTNDKEKLNVKIASLNKEVTSHIEKNKEQDKKIIELTKKNVEIQALHTQALERKDQEFLQVLKKSHMENQILKDQLDRMKDEADSLALRTRNETFMMPQFDQFPRQTLQTLVFDVPGNMSQRQTTGDKSEPEKDEEEETGINEDENNKLDLPEDFRRDSSAAQLIGSSFNRIETMDVKNMVSNNQSRRGSTVSNRLALRQLAFGAGKNTDEKLQAEVNELKIKLKEAHQETSTKVSSMLVCHAHLGRT